MKLRLIVDLLAFTNANPTNDPADCVKAFNASEDEYSEISRHFPRIIQNGAVDEAVTLPDANTDYLLIFTDQEISIKLNSSSDAQTLKPRAVGVKTAVYLMKGDITALSISNSSGADANVDITLIKA